MEHIEEMMIQLLEQQGRVLDACKMYLSSQEEKLEKEREYVEYLLNICTLQYDLIDMHLTKMEYMEMLGEAEN